MKLKIGKDLVNREHVLIIPNQLTIDFDFEFTRMKLITKEGTKTIDIDPGTIKFRYVNPRINFEGKQSGMINYSFYNGQSFYYELNRNYLYLNHNHLKNFIMFFIDNVPFKMEDYDHEIIDNVKEVKCYTNRFVITYNDNLGKTVQMTGNKPLSTWQYYFMLREIVNARV